jgi:hypothetical protein
MCPCTCCHVPCSDLVIVSIRMQSGGYCTNSTVILTNDVSLASSHSDVHIGPSSLVMVLIKLSAEFRQRIDSASGHSNTIPEFVCTSYKSGVRSSFIIYCEHGVSCCAPSCGRLSCLYYRNLTATCMAHTFLESQITIRS